MRKGEIFLFLTTFSTDKNLQYIRMGAFWGNWLTLSQTSPVFMCLHFKSGENTVGKAEIARNEQFLLFSHCFQSFGKHSAIFIKFEIVVCDLFQFGRV